MRSINQLIGRHNRRGQSKIGRFDTDKYANDKVSTEKTEYNLPELRESELERKKEEIRNNIKREKLKTWFYLSMFVIAIVYIFYYTPALRRTSSL